MGTSPRSAYDLCQAMESRQKYQDGRKVDPAAEAKLMAQWEEWKKEEAQDHAEYEQELREEKLRRQAMHEESLREAAAQRYEEDDDDEEEYTWNGSSKDSASQDSSSSDPWAEHKAEHDLGRMPNIIYDSSNNPWHKSWGSPDHVTYTTTRARRSPSTPARCRAPAPRPPPGISTGIDGAAQNREKMEKGRGAARSRPFCFLWLQPMTCQCLSTWLSTSQPSLVTSTRSSTRTPISPGR